MKKKKQNQVEVIFVKDYINKKAGTVLKCDVVMASHLKAKGVAKENVIQTGEEEAKPILKTKPKTKPKRK